MNVFVEPAGLHSRAMVRVANALKRFAPEHLTFVSGPQAADFRVVHVVGTGSLDGVDGSQPHALIQYCLLSAGGDTRYWLEVWGRAQLVWSYYDILEYCRLEALKDRSLVAAVSTNPNCYYAPLGVDEVFTQGSLDSTRHIGLITSGYVSGPCAEAIEEAAIAGAIAGARVLHVGPPVVEGMRTVPAAWSSIQGLNDEALANLYRVSRWVSGLRHVEGFELPALEGLLCGARPILFDRVEMRKWYDGHAEFIPETAGWELVESLLPLLTAMPERASRTERQFLAEKFSWEPIIRGFWERVL